MRVYFLLAGFLALSLNAASFDLSKAKSEVGFLAIGQPSSLKIKGVAQGEKTVAGTFKIEGKTFSGRALLKLSSLDTGIEMRDQHMKEKYLEVQKFPVAELTVTDLSVGAKEAPFKGELKLHGVQKPVDGKATVQANGSELNLTFEFGLLLKDYAIEIPSYLGIKVANEVKITATAEGKMN